MSSSKNKIQDAGEVLPFAKKHLVNESNFNQGTSDVSLRSLWPEPDWLEMIRGGMDSYVASHLAMIYAGLRKSPRQRAGYWREISSEQWEQAYVQGIEILQELFNACFDHEDVDAINDHFAQKLGYNGYKAMNKVKLEKVLPYWAIGRGERTLKHPTSKSPIGRYIADYLPDLGWPESDIALKVGRFPVEFTDGRCGACWLSGRSVHYRDSEIFETVDEALDFILELHKEALAAEETPELKVPKKPSCKNIPRTGPDYRDGDVSAESILERFHFRGVQFGASMGEKEKQTWINAIHDILSDLSNALGFPSGWVGLKGLGIAFGARGAGNALAHYETQLRVINLTREKGASSLGHEWSHGLDHRLSSSFIGWSDFASSNCLYGHGCEQDIMKPVFVAFHNLMTLINDRSTGFYQRSQRVQNIKGARKYWTEPHELFARSFEAFLQDRLQELGIVNPWLVYGTHPEDYHRYEEETFVYPLGPERQEINRLFKALFHELSQLTR